MKKVYLSLGSNIGDKKQNIEIAKKHLQNECGNITLVSDYFETEPWGFSSENNFINIALELETKLSPIGLLNKVLNIEKEIGRVRIKNAKTYNDRLIDIDIVFYENEIINTPDLIIPHPLMHKRLFVLQPLSQIIPDFIHPIFKKSIKHLTNQAIK